MKRGNHIQNEASLPTGTSVEETAAALHAIAEPTRLRILWLVEQAELTVTELCDILGQSQPRVSRHLQLLAQAGLIDRAREGAWAFHRLRRQGAWAGIAHAVLSKIERETQEIRQDAMGLNRVREIRMAKAHTYFNANAAQWDRLRALHVDETHVGKAIRKLLPARHIAEMIDFGAGTGKMLTLLGDRVSHGIGFDLSREMLALARVNLDRAGLRHCVVRLGDIRRLPIANQQADLITIHQVLHYLDDPEIVVREAARTLRPGGRLLVVDFASHSLEILRKRHAHRRLGFAPEEVANWCEISGLTMKQTTRVTARDKLTVLIWAADYPVKPVKPVK